MNSRLVTQWLGLSPILGLVCLLAAQAQAQTAVPAGVSQLPAKTASELTEICAGLLQQGPAGIQAIAQLLVPPGTGNDTQARYALNGLVKYAQRPGAESDRALVAGALAAALKTAANPEIKSFLINQLQLIGHDDVVPALSEYLTDTRLCDPAARALVAIHTPAAGMALAKALPSAAAAERVTLLLALGEIRQNSAVKDILVYAQGEDHPARLAAWFALANIGDPAAIDVLRQATYSALAYERLKANSFFLLLARRLAELGQPDLGEKICRDLLAARLPNNEINVNSAALGSLVTILGERALPDLLKAIDHNNLAFRAAALNLAGAIAGPAATRAWIEKMNAVSPVKRAEIVEMLGQRGDKAALGDLIGTLKDADQTVRLAAIKAVVQLGGPSALQNLVAALSPDNADDIKAAQQALQLLSGEAVVQAAAAALPQAPAPIQKTLLQLLSVRHAQGCASEVFALTKNADASVRLAAMQALGNIAGPSDLPQVMRLFLETKDSAEKAAAQQALVTSACQIQDADQRTEPILRVLDQSAGDQRTALLEVLANVGGNKALRAVAADVSSTTPAVREAALRALANWSDPEAIPELLQVVKTQNDTTSQALAAQGCVRLMDSAEMTPEKQLAVYRELMAAVKRPEEQKLVLAGLANIRTIEALKFAASYLSQSAVQTEAIQAVAKIACPASNRETGLVGKEVQSILAKALELAPDGQVKQRIRRYLNSDTFPRN